MYHVKWLAWGPTRISSTELEHILVIYACIPFPSSCVTLLLRQRSATILEVGHPKSYLQPEDVVSGAGHPHVQLPGDKHRARAEDTVSLPEEGWQ